MTGERLGALVQNRWKEGVLNSGGTHREQNNWVLGEKGSFRTRKEQERMWGGERRGVTKKISVKGIERGAKQTLKIKAKKREWKKVVLADSEKEKAPIRGRGGSRGKHCFWEARADTMETKK